MRATSALNLVYSSLHKFNSMSEPSTRRSLLSRLGLLNPQTGWPGRPLIFILCLITAIVVEAWFRPDLSLSREASRALFILVLAVLLWVTEVVPAFAVGILVIALNVALLGKPAQAGSQWEQHVQVIGHPLIWLFFGGFVLAAGMERCGLDRRMALGLLRRVGGRYRNVMLGTMLATFVLSMFMSNTATTAMMLAVIAPVLHQFETGSQAGKGLLLGIAVAANLGGMGSLIGTPPNAIAVAALGKLDPPQVITFLDWMVIGLPPAMGSMLLIWALLLWIYPDPGYEIQLDTPASDSVLSEPATWQFLVVSGSLMTTIGLWLTSSWHGIPTAAVSFLPIVILTSTGVLSAKDIRGLNYDVLFLMAGGIALGNAVTTTGLSNWIVAKLPVEFLGPVSLTFLLAYVTVMLSNIMSNTAASNILIPLAVTMAAGSETTVAIGVAIAASSAMCLPVATPPNAMVFATGCIKTWDLVRVGLVVGLITPAIGLIWLAFCLKLIY